MDPIENTDAGSMLYVHNQAKHACVHRSVVWTVNGGGVVCYTDLNRSLKSHVLVSRGVVGIGALYTEEKQVAALTNSGLIRIIRAPSSGLAIRATGVLYMEDGDRIATLKDGPDPFLVSSSPYALKVFDVQHQRERMTIPLDEPLSCLEYASANNVFTSSPGGTFRIYDLRTRDVVLDTPVPPRIKTSSVNQYAVYGGSLDAGIGWFDTRKPQWTPIHPMPSASIYASETKTVSCDSVNGDIYSFIKDEEGFIRTRVKSCVHVGYTQEVIIVVG